MSEYVFRDAPGFGCDMNDLMDGGRVTVGEYFASNNTDHYGTLHEEIVRCRDCRHADWDITAWWCTRDKHNPFKIGELRGYGERSQLGGFCAWGKRKVGGDD